MAVIVLLFFFKVIFVSLLAHQIQKASAPLNDICLRTTCWVFLRAGRKSQAGCEKEGKSQHDMLISHVVCV